MIVLGIDPEYPPIGSSMATDKDMARFWSFVDKTGPCWVWTGLLDNSGYGVFSFRGRSVKAHRFIYERECRVIMHTIDHLCGVARCVNPQHMEDVTIRVNVLRGNGRAAVQARQTKCYRGHDLVDVNVAPSSDGRRRCKKCRRIYAKERYAKNREAIREYFKRWYAARKGVK